MKYPTRKLLEKGGMALVIFLLMIGLIAVTNAIQAHLVAKASVSRVSDQQPDGGHTHDSISTATPLPSPTMGPMDHGGLPHSESDPHQSTSGHHNMPNSSAATKSDSGHSESNTSPDTSTKTVVLGSFAIFNGSILAIAAFLKRYFPQRKRALAPGKVNQNSSGKGSMV